MKNKEQVQQTETQWETQIVEHEATCYRMTNGGN